MLDVTDTIAAIATPRAGGIRGIVRISGPSVVSILASLVHCEPEWEQSPAGPPRVISGAVRANDLLGEVPCEIYLWPGVRSYTRQPSAELHTLGSLPVLDAILASLCAAGARLAEPGEFTMRAFLAGRLDLTQAEAVLGVIDSTSEKELHLALSQLAGGLARPLHALRERLLDLLAHLEAGLDFVEEDIEFISAAELSRHLQAATEQVQLLLDQVRARAETTDEPRVVLRGLPNAGKSSLFNALVGAEKSIVSERASTTRDYVTCRIPLAGQSVQLIDTAGIDHSVTEASIDSASQDAATRQSEQATLELFCMDATSPRSEWERAELERLSTVPRILLMTKCDAGTPLVAPEGSIATSSHTGVGLADLRRAIVEQLDRALHAESAVVNCTAVRCIESLRRAADSLRNARSLAEGGLGEELVAAELRVTLDELGSVAGVVYTDDILDRVFSRFCIGK